MVNDGGCKSSELRDLSDMLCGGGLASPPAALLAESIRGMASRQEEVCVESMYTITGSSVIQAGN